MENIWLHRYAVLLAICTLFLVVVGASVTSNDAGLSVPDWPLSYGQLMPPMTGGIFYEHGHRMVASTVGFMTIILVVWLFRAERRSWLKKLGLVALGLVVLQGLLGGLTVLLLLPKAVSIAHACLAELFFSTTAAIALFTSPGWQRGPAYIADSGTPSLRSLAVFTPAVVLCQVLLGAAYRHKLLGIIPHILGALFVAAVVLYFTIALLSDIKDHAVLRRSAKLLMHITLAQILLGIVTYVGRIHTSGNAQPSAVMVALSVTHVAVGAMTLAASILLAIQIRRNVLLPAEEIRLAA